MIIQDPYGNSYYELPAQPQLGKRRPSRWYNTADVSSSDAETGPSEKWLNILNILMIIIIIIQPPPLHTGT